MTPFKQADIQVTDIESKQASTGNWKYKITDSEKNKYYFWRTVKGGDSDVFATFNSMGVKNGDIIHISYTEEEKSFTNNKGETVNYTERFIGSMREAGGNPQVRTPRTEAPVSPQGKSEDFWDKKAYKQCLWAKWLKDSTQLDLNEADWKDIVWQAFKEIEQDAEKRFSPVRQAVEKASPKFFEPEVAPDIAEAARNMEDMIEDIPF